MERGVNAQHECHMAASQLTFTARERKIYQHSGSTPYLVVDCQNPEGGSAKIKKLPMKKNKKQKPKHLKSNGSGMAHHCM